MRRSHAHKEKFQSPKLVVRKRRHAQTVLGLSWLFVCANNGDTVRRAFAAIADQLRRRNARGASSASAWRMIAIRSGRREATGHFLVPSCNLPTVFPAGLAGKILCKKCLILLEQKGRSNAAYAVPPKRTSELSRAMSALCHKRTRAGQQTIRRIRRELRRFPWQARRD